MSSIKSYLSAYRLEDIKGSGFKYDPFQNRLHLLMDQLVSDQHSNEHIPPALLKTLVIVTGKWRLQIIYQLAEKRLRYSDLHRSIPGISEKVLNSELNELVALEFLQKESFREIPPRVEYGLTEKAHTIIPILDQLIRTVERVLI